MIIKRMADKNIITNDQKKILKRLFKKILNSAKIKKVKNRIELR